MLSSSTKSCRGVANDNIRQGQRPVRVELQFHPSFSARTSASLLLRELEFPKLILLVEDVIILDKKPSEFGGCLPGQG
jgi:hypothetical protein